MSKSFKISNEHISNKIHLGTDHSRNTMTRGFADWRKMNFSSWFPALAERQLLCYTLRGLTIAAKSVAASQKSVAVGPVLVLCSDIVDVTISNARKKETVAYSAKTKCVRLVATTDAFQIRTTITKTSPAVSKRWSLTRILENKIQVCCSESNP